MNRRWPWLVLALFFFAQALFAAKAASLTTDEILHIESGYASLSTGDYRLVEEHPPLTKMLEALPLLFLRPPLPDPRTLPGWDEADLLTVAQAAIPPHKPIEPLVFAARVPVALLGVVLLALIWRWATALWGEAGGVLAVALAAFDPNLIAHAAVAATDLGATVGIFAASFLFRRWLHAPTTARTLALGVGLGLALGTKTTALLLLPLFALLLLVLPARRPPARHLRKLLPLLLTTFVTLWGLYRFRIGPLPPLVDFPIPMPDALRPLIRLSEHLGDRHAAFLLGEKYDGGRAAYFPVAFLLKTPLLTLGLLGLTAGGLALRRLRSAGWRQEVALLALPLLYFAVSVAGEINIGYRHLLPILPFLFVWIGRWGRGLQRPATALLAAALWAGYALTSLTIAPWYLSYFNALAGGPDNGWRYLTDANTDWGQGYKALADFERREGIPSVRLAAFITYDPGLVYGVAFEPLTPYGGFTPPIFPRRFAPPPGDYVISTTPLDGVPLADPEMYDWFRWRRPDAVIAHALHYYRVTAEETAVAWVARCVTPTIPLDGEAIDFGFGAGKRVLDFDCTRSWVVPPEAGAYLLHGSWVEDGWAARLHYAPPPLRDSFIAARLEETGARLVYRQRRTTATPPFVIYRTGATPLLPEMPVAYPAPATSPPSAQTTAAPCTVGPLRLIGAESRRGEQGIEVLLWWEVVAAPPAANLSMMGHLLDEEGRPVGIDDGLGYLPTQWQVGDRFAQRFRFPAAAGRLWVRTGLYRLETLERLPVAEVPGADACFIPLPP